jgi:DHA1 family multidrug resistance protein-like MFS transporter
MKIAPYVDEQEGFTLPQPATKPSAAPSIAPSSRDESQDEADKGSEKDIEKEQSDRDVENVPVEQETQVAQQLADPNIVGWAGPTDEDNPQNWSTAKKSFVFGQICLLTFSSEFTTD